MGRSKLYEEWLTDESLILLEGWAREGLTDKQIAEEKIGIAQRTFERWKSDYPAIKSALKKGKTPVDFKVENALLKRALGYVYEEEISEKDSNGKTHMRRVKKQMPPDVTALIFWLKNRRPDKWRDHPEIKIEDNEDFTRASEILKGIDSAIN